MCAPRLNKPPIEGVTGVSIINRRLSETNAGRAKSELAFLLGYLDSPRFRGELAIEFRGPSELGVYDRGFRLAQVKFLADGSYRVRTHARFIRDTPLADERRYPRDLNHGSYATFEVGSDRIHRLLQANHIAAMRRRIKEITRHEEIGVSHVVASDTSVGTDVVVIDREVGDSAPELRGQRLDLVALQEVDSGLYRFLAVEVKLGNNPELDIVSCERRGDRHAVEQSLGYRDQIDRYFDDYAACYRVNIAQKIELGLLRNGWTTPPAIIPGAEAVLVVVGYSGIARPLLDVIQRRYSDVKVRVFGYGLQSEDGQISGLRRPFAG